MARQVLPIVGAAAGAAIGGVAGAEWGWMIGSVVGNIVDPVVTKGPAIGDIAQQTSQEGVPRPIVFAVSPPMAGNIVACGQPVIHTKKSSGKGAPKTQTQTVTRTYAIGVCEGPIASFLRVWRNGTLVFDVLNNSLPSGTNEAWLKACRFFLGDYDQMPSPDLEADDSIGAIPAMRGTAYMVMPNEDLTDLQGAVPQYAFQVYRQGGIAVQNAFLTNKYLTGSYVYTPGETGLFPRAQIISLTPTNDVVTAGTETGEIIFTGSGNGANGVLKAFRLIAGQYQEIIGAFPASPVGAGVGFTNGILTASNDAKYVIARVYGTGATTPKQTSYFFVRRAPNIDIWDLIQTYVAGFTGGIYLGCLFSPNGKYLLVGYAWWTYDGSTSSSIVGGLAEVTDTGLNPLASISDMTNADACTWHPNNNLFIAGINKVGVDTQVWSVSLIGYLTSVATQQLGTYLSGDSYGGKNWVYSPNGQYVLVADLFHDYIAMYSANNSAPSPYFVASGHVMVGSRGMFLSGDGKYMLLRGTGNAGGGQFTTLWACDWSGVPSFIQINGTQLAADLDNNTLNVEPLGWAQTMPNGVVPITPTPPYPLSSIIDEVCESVGMTTAMFDSSALVNINVRGFAIINTYATSSALQALSQIFLFDPSNYDGVLHFVPRGQDVTAPTITADELVLASDGTTVDVIDQSQASDPISIPRVLTLNYYDIAGGISTDKQSSTRAGDRRATGEQSLQTSIILSADEAASIVAINHAVMIEDQKQQLTFGLTDSRLALTTADNVFIEWDGQVIRARLTQVDLNDGQQAYTGLRDRQSAYTISVQGYPAYTPTSPPSRIVGPTLIQPLDIHLLRDTDDRLGCYLAIGGQTAAWAGATVELSLDGGANYIDSFITTTDAVMGTITSAFPIAPQDYPDLNNSFTVNLPDTTATLEASNQTGLQNGDNLCIVGNELIQFANINEVSQGIYTLSYLLRGRIASAPVAHIAGERFVMLNRNDLNFIDTQLNYLGRTLTLRATSIGGDPDTDITVISFVFTGQSQVEKPVAYLRGHRDATNLILAWQGVGKLGGGASSAMGAFFVNYDIVLTAGSITQTFDQTAQSLTTPFAAFGTSAVTVKVTARNSLTGLGPSVSIVV